MKNYSLGRHHQVIRTAERKLLLASPVKSCTQVKSTVKLSLCINKKMKSAGLRRSDGRTVGFERWRTRGKLILRKMQSD